MQPKSIVVDEIEVFTQAGHKAEIRRSGTFRESCGAINLQHVVRSGCNVVVN